ncbi:hypothetical protein CIB48_g10185 [Xylaria polymorpha]|nr:hypothetical protein CIB48_g10185 [Xylaria polymorpha]
MRGFIGLAAAALATFFAQAVADPTVAHPGGVHDIIITEDNIINSTTRNDLKEFKTNAAQAGAFPISVVNNFDNGMNMYISGKDASGRPCLLGANGQFVYPQADGTGVPQEITGNIALPLGAKGQTTQVTLPQALISARIWLAHGQLKFYTVRDGNGVSAIVEPSAANPADPSAGIQWGFIEFNYDGTTIYANISFVDFVGIPLGMGLTLAGGQNQIVQGLQAGAVNNICNGVRSQAAADGQIWDRLCTVSSSGQALRVLAPNLYTSGNPTAFTGYYVDYVNQVWSKYSSQDLVINTQAAAGNVACRVSNNQLQCNATTMFIVPSFPRLCAAFTRTTLLLAGGNVQPSLGQNSYYTMNPTSHYSRIVHQYETNSLGYAFSYDDVNPDGQNAAGVVAGANPTNLKITVGGWS